MAKLEGQSIASSYEQLLHVDRDGGGNGTTLVDVKDGKNTTTFALKLATDKAEIDGALTIDQDSNVSALTVDTEATTAHGIFFNAPTITEGNVLLVDGANSLTTGRLAYFGSNSSDNSSRNLFEIQNINSSATGATALKITQNSTGLAIHSTGDVLANGGINTGTDMNNRAIISYDSGALTLGTRVSSTNYFDTLRIKNGLVGIGAVPEKTLTISSANAQLHIKESDAGTNLKNWLFNAEGGVLYYQTLTDALGGGSTYLQVNRTEQTVTQVSFPSGDVSIGDTTQPRLSAVSGVDNGLRIAHASADGDVAYFEMEGKKSGADADVCIMSFNNADSDDTYKRLGEIRVSRVGADNSGQFSFRTDNAGTFGTRMTITSAGTVGIGNAGTDRSARPAGYAVPKLAIEGTAFDGALTVIENQNDISGGLIAIGKSRGTSVNANTIVQNGDIVGRLTFNPADGTDVRINGGEIRTVVNDSSPAENAIACDLLFMTNDSTSIDAATRFRLDGNSRISLSNNDLGTQNTVFGSLAGANIDAGSNYNVFIGHNVAGGSLNDATQNTGIGYSALANLTSGDTNTAIGRSAGLSITTGTLNTFIGKSVAGSSASATNQTAIGADVTAQGDNTVTLGNASVTDVYMASDSGAIVHTAGIQFPASQVANGGANVLDDYEEGFHTAVVSPSSSGSVTQNASFDQLAYTKIGRLVTVTGRIYLSGISSPTGHINITMPFTVADLDERSESGSASVTFLNVTGANIADFVALFTNGGASLEVYLGDGTTVQSDSANALTATTEIFISAQYFTA